ncbi:MAG: NADH-quinone oxidoreductase subunit NuoE [Candidatus Aminicenantes bacterium]|nr:NADH-quinone oxidoreductase subunit NuoE [Candidatus Aminicenantes bacterium]
MSHNIPDRVKRRVEDILSRYPRREAALLPVLSALQEERGFLSHSDEEWAADTLGIPPAKVREVVTFYSLFRRKPAGRHHLQVCTNVSCALNGADGLLSHLRKKLGIAEGETSADGRFSLSSVECLGHCDEAPCLMVNDEHYGRLDRRALDELLEKLE